MGVPDENFLAMPPPPPRFSEPLGFEDQSPGAQPFYDPAWDQWAVSVDERFQHNFLETQQWRHEFEQHVTSMVQQRIANLTQEMREKMDAWQSGQQNMMGDQNRALCAEMQAHQEVVCKHLDETVHQVQARVQLQIENLMKVHELENQVFRSTLGGEVEKKVDERVAQEIAKAFLNAPQATQGDPIVDQYVRNVVLAQKEEIKKVQEKFVAFTKRVEDNDLTVLKRTIWFPFQNSS